MAHRLHLRYRQIGETDWSEMRYSFQEREYTEAYAKRRTAPIESFGYEVRYTITSDDGSEPTHYETAHRGGMT